MPEIFQYGFMVRAFIAGTAIAVAAPLIGTFLVARRYSLIADTLAHVSLAGVAIGLLLGVYPLITTVFVAVLASIAIERLRATGKSSGETILAMFLPGGLALAVVLISLANGLNANLFSYLFGSISTVSSTDLILILALGVAAVVTVAILNRQFLFTSFDTEGAHVAGIPVGRVNLVLMVLTAVTVSLATRIVGALLVGALMVIPVVTAAQVARSFRESQIIAVIVALFAVIGGLFLAFYLNIPAGGAIVLLALVLFGVSSVRGRAKRSA